MPVSCDAPCDYQENSCVSMHKHACAGTAAQRDPKGPNDWGGMGGGGGGGQVPSGAPSCLHTTAAALLSHVWSHTADHLWDMHTWTVPSLGVAPPTKHSSPLQHSGTV